MIGFVRGTLIQKIPPVVVIDVQGVGYEVDVPMSTFFALPDVGENVSLLTHLHVREDIQALYGFVTEAERQLFRNLMKVSGVGAKLALTILSGVSTDEFIRCVHEEDKAALVRLPGVGKKTAERLILDMRDRVGPLVSVTAAGAGGDQGGSHMEAFNALTALGYKTEEARKMLRSAGSAEGSTEEILQRVLSAAANGKG
jgi:Holliday junction DNA helicase RuvA